MENLNTRTASFTAAYIEAALWSSIGDDGEPIQGDLAPEARAAMELDCAAFYAANASHIGSETEAAGHDFWLTRCGHGAGFWDGDWAEPAASELTAASEEAGNVDLYVGDDGLIYMAQG
jgi:hypothetical protein